MLIFLKNMAHFMFGKPLNGMIFAERERERERIRARIIQFFFQNYIHPQYCFYAVLWFFFHYVILTS